MYDLSGKNVVYVGGFGGIGIQICHILMHKKINHLIVCDRMENVEMLSKLQNENPSVKVMFVHMNIMDRVNIEHAVQQIVGVVKQIDVLINGAGVLMDKDVDTTIGVNLSGLIHTTLTCLPHMDKTQMGRGGIVVNISSVYGLEPSPAYAVYAASKHGVVGFTRSLGHEHYLKKTGVSFICVCPGLTNTELMANLRDNVTWAHHSDEFVDVIQKAKRQSPEECATNVVKAVELWKNGAIYICNLGELKEVTPTTYWKV